MEMESTLSEVTQIQENRYHILSYADLKILIFIHVSRGAGVAHKTRKGSIKVGKRCLWEARRVQITCDLKVEGRVAPACDPASLSLVPGHGEAVF